MNNFEVLLQAVEAGEKVQTVTLIVGPKEHNRHLGEMIAIFTADKIDGSIIDVNFTEKIVAEIKNKVWDKPCIVDIYYEGRTYQVFWNIIGNEKVQAIILGGGHISQPLVRILSLLEYEVIVVDDRPEFANSERFPGAQRVICDSFAKVLQEIEPDDNTAVIIVTRGHRYDLDCLRSVIGTNAGYIGMIGSRRKVRATLQVLQDEGVEKQIVDRVRAPIGLDIGGQSPAEIAVSIAAEVIATFKKGNCLPLSCQGKDARHG